MSFGSLLAGVASDVLGPAGANASACFAAIPRHAQAVAASGLDFDACAAGLHDSVLWELRFFPPTYALWPSPALPRYLDQPMLDPKEAAEAKSKLRAGIRAHWAHEPLGIPLSLCAPKACDATMVQEVLVPRHLELTFVGMPLPMLHSPLETSPSLAQPVSRLPPVSCCSTIVSWTTGGRTVKVPPLARFRHGDWPLDVGGEAAVCASLLRSVAGLERIPFGASLQALLLRGGESTIPLEDPIPAQCLVESHIEACGMLGIQWHAAVVILLRDSAEGQWPEEQFMICHPCTSTAMAQLLKVALIPPSLRAPGAHEGLNIQVLVQKLMSWSMLPPGPGGRHAKPGIDFAIIGFAKSGTTTLARNLNAHPNISMANCGPPCPAPGRPLEEGRHSECETCEFRFWSLQHVNDFFPPLTALVDLRERFDPAKVQAGALRGLKDSPTIRFTRQLSRLEAVPGLRLLVTIRDPVDSFESRYNWYSCGRRYGRDPVQMAEQGLHSCSLFRHPDAPYTSESEQLGALLARMPRSRVHVLHAEALRRAPEEP